jgi:hypothetical protein
VSAGPEPQVDTQAIEQERRRLSKRLEEVARLAEGSGPPAAFYGEMLKRLLESLAAPAGAVWTRTAQGNLQLMFHINMKEVGLDRSDEARAAHEELLRRAVAEPRPMHLLPHSGLGPAADGKPPAGNPSDLLLLLVPILLNDQVAGLVEVWQGPGRPPAAIPGFLQFMALMADLCARYQRNQIMGQMAGQQQLWTKLEDFARKIHGSLNPVEVGYLIVNDARRLIECDRVSVAVRYARKAKVVAVSGVDVVETRSDLVQRMRTLADRVLEWGERLTFNGVRDDGLPPKVLQALDAYLETSSSKLLVLQPLRDEREGKEPTQPARAALLMECFEPPAEPQQIIARMDVVAKHATPALYNSVEHRRIPMRWIWLPLAKVQEGIGGKGRAISAAVAVALSLLISILVLVPYPLKMESKGELLPEIRRNIYAPVAGSVKRFTVVPTDEVPPDRDLAVLYDLQMLKQVSTLESEMISAQKEAEEAENQAKNPNLPPPEVRKYLTEAAKQRNLEETKRRELDAYMRRTNAIPGEKGAFVLRAPQFTAEEKSNLPRSLDRQLWTVLSGNFREDWTDRMAQPSDALLRLGAKDGPWEIMLKIPQKHIGQVLHGFDYLNTDQLDVDFLLRSDPTKTYRGILERKRIAGEATPGHDDNNEPEPYVVAFVRVAGKDIPEDLRLRGPLTSGTEVHAKVRCGNHKLGYALFYGVWEFLYEKVVFFF